MKLFPKTRMLKEAESCTRKPQHIIIEILICLLVLLVAMTLESLVVTPCTLVAIMTDDGIQEMLSQGTSFDFAGMMERVYEIMQNLPDWIMLAQLFATVGMILAVLIYVRKLEKRNTASLGLARRGMVGEYLAGLGIGLCLFSGAVGICVLSGHMTLSPVRAPRVGTILLFFLAYLIQGFSEELLCRGYLMVTLSRRYPVWACVLANSLFFAALHVGNPGMSVLAFVNLTLFGVLASLYTLRRGSLWGIAAIHSVWNFAQGNLFGISVSGSAVSPSFLTSSMGEGTAAKLFHGGSFGLEGGLGVTVVLAVGTLILLLLPTKKSERVEENPVPGGVYLG